MLSTIAEIIRDLLIFVGVIAALLIALVVVVSMMPNTNPLKRVLTALCYRLGATLAAGAVAIPLEPIPGIDLLYDIGVPIVLILVLVHVFQGRSSHDFRHVANRSEASNLMAVDDLIRSQPIVNVAVEHGARKLIIGRRIGKAREQAL